MVAAVLPILTVSGHTKVKVIIRSMSFEGQRHLKARSDHTDTFLSNETLYVIRNTNMSVRKKCMT